MNEYKNKSAFYHFGILPGVSIHSPVEDAYSKMYRAEEMCKCGCSEWVDGQMSVAEMRGVPCMFIPVHRCKECNKVRMAKHIGVE